MAIPACQGIQNKYTSFLTAIKYLPGWQWYKCKNGNNQAAEACRAQEYAFIDRRTDLDLCGVLFDFIGLGLDLRGGRYPTLEILASRPGPGRVDLSIRILKAGQEKWSADSPARG